MAEIESPIDVEEEVEDSEQKVPKAFRPLRVSKEIRDIDKQAERMTKELTLPKIPSKDLKFDKMMEWLGLLTEDMWSKISIYIYRTRPSLILKEPKYTEILVEKFDRDYIIRKHGGGDYTFYVKGDNKELFRSSISISTALHEPLIDLAELDLNDYKNKPFIANMEAKGYRVVEGKLQKINDTTPIVQNSNNEMIVGMMNRMFDMMGKMNQNEMESLKRKLDPENNSLGKTVGDILVEKMKQDDPNKALTVLTPIMTIMKDIVGAKPQDTGISEIIKLMIAQMQASMASQQTLMLEMMKSKSDDGLGSLDKVLALADRINEGRGGGSGKRSTGEVILDGVEKLAVPALTLISNILAARSGKGQAVTIEPNVPTQQQPTNVTTMPRQASDMYRNPALAKADPEDMNTPSAPQIDAGMQMIVQLINQFGGLMLQNMQAGKDGWEVAEMAAGLYGVQVKAAIESLKTEGVDKVVAVMMTNAQFAELGQAYLLKWVNEFLNYEQVIAEMERDGE